MIITKDNHPEIFESISSYIKELIDIQLQLLAYLDASDNEGNDDNEDQNFQELTNCIKESKILENKDKIKSFFHLLFRIFNNHHRSADFLQKFDKITNHYKTYLFNYFSKDIIFNLFRQNKRFTLSIFGEPLKNEHLDPQLIKDLHFSNDKKDTQEIFEKKIRAGENDDILCGFIQKDNIDDFCAYTAGHGTRPDKRIIPSQFESHSYLFEENEKIIGRSLKLIEYAAFFGSFQVFKNLQYSNATMEEILWFTSIYGRNTDIFHLLKEQSIPQPSMSLCIKEAIKCHHNEYVDHIADNYKIDGNHEQLYLETAFESYNFEIIEQKLQIPEISINGKLIRIFLENDYYQIMKNLVDSKLFDPNIPLTSSETKNSAFSRNPAKPDYPLLIAIRNGSAQMVQLLLEFPGINIDKKFIQKVDFLITFQIKNVLMVMKLIYM